MKVTSAGASKMIKQLEDRKKFLLTQENESSIYVLAENEKSTPPSYYYEETKKELDEVNRKIRLIKHAINLFNITTVLEGLNITIDEALVEMAQLNRRKETLDVMRKRLPKQRLNNSYVRTNLIEYVYVNYDLAVVNKDYDEMCQRIFDIQLALDHANQVITFEINL